MKYSRSKIAGISIAVLTTLLFGVIVNAQAQTANGRLWDIDNNGAGITVIDRATNAQLASFNVGQWYSTVDRCTGLVLPQYGRGIAYDPTDGNIWFTVDLGGGGMDGGTHGDTLIHKMPSMGGPDVAQIPDPTSLPNSGFSRCWDGIGALDYDSDENVLYAISYRQKPDGTGFPWIYKLDASIGSVLNSFPYRGISDHNSTLAIVHPAGLGTEKALKVNGAVIDINNGALLSGSFSSGFGLNGIDEDEVTGQVVNTPLAPWARKDISVEDGHRCDCELIARPPAQAVSTNWPDPDNKLNWSMQVEVSDTDGLVVRDVKLGQRYMAEKISVPYFNLETSVLWRTRVELKPDGGNDPTASSRLINYHVFSDDQKLIIQATYLIDRIPSSAKSCLHVTQRYEFYKEGVLACEPSETIKCSNYKTLVKYNFFDQGETLTAINVAQRIRYKAGGYSANTASLFSDCDGQLGCIRVAGVLFKDKQNPLFGEYNGRVIANGQSTGSWDNVHQTYQGIVDEPPSSLFTLVFAGCPECVHSHWRWGSTFLIGVPGLSPIAEDFNYFQPYVPKGSTQSLDFAVVKYWSSEEDPNDYVTLVNDERIRHPQTGFDSTAQSYDYSSPDATVLWYSATSGKRNDTFFIQPGFFYGADVDAVAPITMGTSGSANSSTTPASKDNRTLNALTSSEDHPTSVSFAYRYTDGPTTYVSLDPATIAAFPVAYSLYDADSYNVITEAETSGPHTVSFELPSVSDPAVFATLRVLHAEPDQADPSQTIWVDRTILSPDTPAPDFTGRTIHARVNYLGPFVIATVAEQPPTGAADLSVDIDASSDPVTAGNELTYSLSVANIGPQTATEVILINGLSPQVDFVSASSSYGTCKEVESNVTCKLNPINAGANATVSIVVKPLENRTSFPPEGIKINHTAFVRAKQSDGITDNNVATKTTTVLPDSNAAPTVSITSPTIGSQFVGPANITITSIASDSNGTVSKVDLFDNGELLGTADSVSAGQYSLVWNNVAFGNHVLVAKATDNLGREKSSSPIAISVNGLATVNISSPVAGVVFNRPANISVTANASYSGGNLSKVEFYANGTLIGTGAVTGPGQYAITWNDAPGGSYVLSAVATDDTGVATVSSPINITVNDYPEVSLTSPIGTQQYTAPASINLTARASDIDGRIGHVTFFANGSPICSRATLGAFQYICTWANVPAGSYTLTAVATDNSGADTASNSVNVTVNAPPTVSLTGPASGTQFVTPTNIVVTSTASDSDGSVSRVDINANGSFIGTATAVGQNQYSITWTNAKAGDYTLTAVATDNRGATTTSNLTSIRVFSPALFVVGSTTLSSSDSVVKTRLEALNYIVTVKSGTTAATADATGKAIVVISSTVTPTSVGTKFRTVAVPVVLWESDLYDDMGMTNTTNTSFGTTTKQTQVKIINPSHPMADGMQGQPGVTTSSGTVSWGRPNPNAVSIATLVGDTTKIVIFGYEQGAVMPGLTAPARRVGLFMHDTTAANFYTPGQRFFDAAIKWVAGR